MLEVDAGLANPVSAGLCRLDAPARLVTRHGAEAGRVAALGELDPEMAEPVDPHTGITAAEVLWAVRHEGALDAEDVLDRRTRIGLVPAEREAALPMVESLVAKALSAVTS